MFLNLLRSIIFYFTKQDFSVSYNYDLIEKSAKIEGEKLFLLKL